MKLILNDIKHISLKNISFYKKRIYYNINDIRIDGLYFKINKNMVVKDNKYKVYITKDIFLLNDLISEKYKSFINDIENPYIEVIQNNITREIYKDNIEYLVLNFRSINENNYPKIHILPWKES